MRHFHNFPVLEVRRGEDFFLARIPYKMGIAAIPVSLSPEKKRYRFAFRGIHTPHHGHTMGIFLCQ
ncbi:hypothetical protein NXX09_24205 [Bacteroides uniformis]|nr:hypothetical protein [Bacteroides uniformis]